MLSKQNLYEKLGFSMNRLMTVLSLMSGVVGVLCAAPKSTVEILAKSIESTGQVVEARGDIVVDYNGSLIKANHVSYDKEKQLLVLEGNVESIGYKGTKERADRIEIETEKNAVSFKNLFMASDNDLWLYAREAHRNAEKYSFGESVLSSCDVTNPLWELRFARSLYNADKKYMKIYGAKVYFKDIPVFYFPYLAFSTNRERSSGLLFPLFGYSQRDGFVYEQRIFWAISPSMDIEFNPQIRTSRSLGIYATLRFVDTDHSSGKMRIGYFKDKDSYVQKYHLTDSNHYGFEFNYESAQLFANPAKNQFRDGLYLNLTYLNDIDYLNLQKSNLQHFGRTPIQESRLNYFLYSDDYYAGVNAKYFIDTRKENNDETLQVLPSIQLHKFLDTLISDNLTYSVDLQMKNLDRTKGSTLKQFEFEVPIEYTLSLFGDYLQLTLREQIYYQTYLFGNGDYLHETFTHYGNLHQLRLYSTLTKAYKNYIHVIQPSLEYTKPGSSKESPVMYADLSDMQRQLFNIEPPEEAYSFAVSNYIYDENAQLILYDHFAQKYYPNRAYKFADVSNELLYNASKWNLYNYLVYAPEFNSIRESFTSIGLKEKSYTLSLSHIYKKVLADQPAAQKANDINLYASYSLNDHYQVSAGVSYSIDDSISRQWSIGGRYHEDCWNLSATLRQDITPRPVGYSKENAFYLQLNFIPFGGIGIDNVGQ